MDIYIAIIACIPLSSLVVAVFFDMLVRRSTQENFGCGYFLSHIVQRGMLQKDRQGFHSSHSAVVRVIASEIVSLSSCSCSAHS